MRRPPPGGSGLEGVFVWQDVSLLLRSDIGIKTKRIRVQP
jgi:hypothetical protein